MVTSGTKRTSDKTLIEFSMAVDSKKNISLISEFDGYVPASLIQCYIVKIGSIHYHVKCRRLR